MEVPQVLGISLAALISIYFVSITIVKLTYNYRKTPTRLDDHANRFFGALHRAVKKTKELFFPESRA